MILTELFSPKNLQHKILSNSNIQVGFEFEMIMKNDDEVDWDSMTYSELEDRAYIPRITQHTIENAYKKWFDREAEHLYVKETNDEDDTISYNEWFSERKEDLESKYDIDTWIKSEFSTITGFIDHYDSIVDRELDDTAIEKAYEKLSRRLYNTFGYECQICLKHSNDTKSSEWVIEPDGSIDTRSNEIAVELVSPVFDLQDGVNALRNILSYIDKSDDLSTNSSTALHVNLSIKGKKLEDYDYLKMLIFYDESFVAKLFNRENNTYAKLIKSSIKTKPRFNEPRFDLTNFSRDKGQLLNDLKQSGFKIANEFGKYYSIHLRSSNDGIFEFRSIGGDMYDTETKTIIRQVTNMAYLLQIGSDPNQLADDYIRKVVKLAQSDVGGITNELLPGYVDVGKMEKQDPQSFLTYIGMRIMHGLEPTENQWEKLATYSRKVSFSTRLEALKTISNRLKIGQSEVNQKLSRLFQLPSLRMK
jgi:hypothetical protein